MKQFTVTQAEAGQRLDKFLGKYLNKAPKSFLYKMMRKKNITSTARRPPAAKSWFPGMRSSSFSPMRPSRNFPSSSFRRPRESSL